MSNEPIFDAPPESINTETSDRVHHPRNMRVHEDGGPDDHRSEIFFAAVETTRMPMVITDPRQHDNPIIFANAAFVEMTGYQLDEIVGRNCRFLQGQKTDPAAVTVIRDGIERKKEASVEMLNYKKDGTPFWNALFISPVRNNEGEILYFFGSQLDVTRRRVAEDSLRQSQKMEALGQLTGGLAHDFNNLLQVVIGHLDRTRMKVEAIEDHTVIHSIDQAMLAAEKGAALTQQLLSFARKQRLNQQSVNLTTLVNSVSELVRRTIGQNIDYRVSLNPSPLLAEIDATQAESALLNVLINARDAMPDGGTVTLSTFSMVHDVVSRLPVPPDKESPHGYACISVNDTGHGMPQDVLDRITEPFFTTKDQGKGTGLGLSMVYGFMRQSNGTMHIESEVNKGTTVSLIFPRQLLSKARSPDAPAPQETKEKETILVVEDQPELMELTATVLREAGYTVVTAANGNRAIEIAESNQRIDAIFTDIIMPGGINGITVVQEIHKFRPHVRALLTTGFTDSMTEDNSASRIPILQKPYRPSVLITAIRKLLDADLTQNTLHTPHAG